MSKIVLSGNASGTGTITIAAPNTNADVTINLPVDGGALPYQSALISYTPIPTAQTGTISTYTSSGSYVKTGRLVTFSISLTITNRGTGAGILSISLPFPSSQAFACAVDGNSTATLPYASGLSGQSTVGVLSYNDATVIANGAFLVLSGTYATAS